MTEMIVHLSDGTAETLVSKPAPPVPDGQYFRILHEWEREQSLFRTAVPEVYTLLSNEHFSGVEFTPALQWLSYYLFRMGAPSLADSLSKTRWTSLLDYQKAFMNGSGFGNPEDPRQNVVTGAAKGYPFPETDKDRLCGGITVKVYKREVLTWYNHISKRNETSEVGWIETINPTNLPSLEELIKSPWLWFHCTICYRASTGKFPNGIQANAGIYEPTWFLLITNTPVFYPMKWMQATDGIADPYKFYLPSQSLLQAALSKLRNSVTWPPY